MITELREMLQALHARPQQPGRQNAAVCVFISSQQLVQKCVLAPDVTATKCVAWSASYLVHCSVLQVDKQLRFSLKPKAACRTAMLLLILG